MCKNGAAADNPHYACFLGLLWGRSELVPRRGLHRALGTEDVLHQWSYDYNTALFGGTNDAGVFIHFSLALVGNQ